MRNTLIFAGSSCPKLTDQICTNLGMASAPVELTQFANGETSVKIMTSIREKDVFVVQSGSSKINDSIMELLIMISACKGGSANKITAVLPYFPYSRQSKKKSHRGAITARMLANLLHVAGINHVITVDLHASQMQGFFKCPVDNLHAEPLIARWIRRNVQEWNEAVCVSKNAGGTKRVTSLADALKLNFGMVTTDRRRTPANMSMSMIMNQIENSTGEDLHADINKLHIGASPAAEEETAEESKYDGEADPTSSMLLDGDSVSHQTRARQDSHPSPPQRLHNAPSAIRSGHRNSVGASSPLIRAHTTPAPRSTPVDEAIEAQYTDERAREVTHGRLVQGHIVSDDYPSPTQSAMSSSLILERPEDDPMSISMASSIFNPEPHALGGTADAAGDASDEEEEGFKDPSLEQMITLVGDVRNRTVFIVDDMIDKAGSWIAAAETVVKRGGAKKVYCIATHGLFGGDALEELQNCDCIDTIVVTNSFPIPPEKAKDAKKLQILDLSKLLSEAIRRNHYGESISALFTHSSD
ncbi:putative ribose-phosphate pyrophosphokinase 1 protein [Botrytis fragariae]|uniref:Ribose-phosphate pyrophosphokinase 1 n=1 Tax=Botrytis fragariae TaxID=1964551 RepID=A0A8H6AJ62_9HELO|nr:putative ribose-phosphate pyrophosphokinase 1 protein [Botrytis fragariae]KAF5868280.1 putative ribose-phosphate pyrophosphokinase 1 protein [Botrytis fragariae]